MQLVLYGVVALLLGFVALPNRPAADPTPDARARVAVRLAELRAALLGYHEREGRWPPSLVVALDAAHGPVPKLLADGSSAPPNGSQAPSRDWLLNPLNGLSTIWVLAPGASFPAQADGTTGWIYNPTTGEVRSNTPDSIAAAGEPWSER